MHTCRACSCHRYGHTLKLIQYSVALFVFGFIIIIIILFFFALINTVVPKLFGWIQEQNPTTKLRNHILQHCEYLLIPQILAKNLSAPLCCMYSFFFLFFFFFLCFPLKFLLSIVNLSQTFVNKCINSIQPTTFFFVFHRELWLAQ